MSTLAIDDAQADVGAVSVHCDEDSLHVMLTDGRELRVPLAWFPRLLGATPSQRSAMRLIGAGEGIHWEEIDEDLSVAGLLAGNPARASS